MKSIDDKLDSITEVWNHYFLNYKFCQSKINFNEEVKTNYYGDILHYFIDTLKSLSDLEYVEDFNASIFQAIGVMQVIYAQQDLIDELLYIFKLPESLPKDKNPNREIRNELVGHPIKRHPKGNELISSVFFGRHFSNGTINYILYSKSNFFSGKSVYHHLDDIIDRHNNFLHTYLDIIWTKCRSILNDYKKKLSQLQNILNNIDFKKLLNFTEHNFELIFKDNYLFKKEYLEVCYSRRNEHPRYSYAVSLFKSTLEESLSEQINSIERSFQEKKITLEKPHEPTTIKFIDYTESSLDQNKKQYLSYEFSKLHDKHPIWGINYFKKHFKNNDEVYAEIMNMEMHMGNDLEYYSSYEYLRTLLVSQGHLRS